MKRAFVFICFLMLIIPSISISEENQIHSYIIITTNAIVDESSILDVFIQHKESLGYNVNLITEDDYDNLKGSFPNLRPDRIRQWLINNYEEMNIEYVLLIGDPTPATYNSLIRIPNSKYSIPMKNFRDRMWFYYITGLPIPLALYENPSDYYYADLDSDWNSKTLLFCGDTCDYKSGNINLEAEVYVGRIPIYQTIDEVDTVLQKTIEYENDTETSWRKSSLIACTPANDRVDFALFGDYIINQIMIPANFSYWRMYYKDSAYECEEPLNSTTFLNRWTENQFGIVCFAAHGWTYGILPYIDYETVEQLNDDYPSIVFLQSCFAGYPEEENLGASLLKNGAIGVICASRTIWFKSNVTEFNQTYESGGLFYRFLEKTVQNYPIGKAFFQAKNEIEDIFPDDINLIYYFNLLRVNLYGDPSITLLDG